MQKNTRRQFGGKTTGFYNNKEANFEKRHLKAYLNGHKRFQCGSEDGRPIYFPVKENWIEE